MESAINNLYNGSHPRCYTQLVHHLSHHPSTEMMSTKLLKKLQKSSC